MLFSECAIVWIVAKAHPTGNALTDLISIQMPMTGKRCLARASPQAKGKDGLNAAPWPLLALCKAECASGFCPAPNAKQPDMSAKMA
jgi:hypothetical protein